MVSGTVVEQTTLGNVASFVRGITFKPADIIPLETDGAVACMRTKNVQTALDLSDVWAIPANLVKRPDQMLKRGDILVSSANSWNLVGKCCWVPELPWKSTFGGFISVLRGANEGIDARYLYHWFSSPWTQATVRSFGQQTTNISNLNVERCLALPIRLPSILEQRRIAAILDRADALRATRRAALAQLDTLPDRLLGKVLVAERVDHRLKLGDCMDAIIDYRGKSPLKSSAGIPLITARIVKNGRILTPTEYILAEDYVAWMRRGLPKAGDVVFTSEAPLGEVARLDSDRIALAQRIILLRGRSGVVHNAFLEHVLRWPSVRGQIEARATGSTVRGIRQSELREVVIPVPSFEAQQRFANLIAIVNKTRRSVSKSLDGLDDLFASLQHRAFRGEL
jgi:type I restriction enzyme S subunit